MSIQNFETILFDLDGTILDTAPEFNYCINILLTEKQQPAAESELFRSTISLGAREMVRQAFQLSHDDQNLDALLKDFLALYISHLGQRTVFFPEMDKVIQTLEDQNIAWGIITNKSHRYTDPLLAMFPLLQKAACVVCGDTLSTQKPDSAPLLHGLKIINKAPHTALYIGDAKTDVEASQNAGTKSMVAEYGYIPKNENPKHWQADFYIQKPEQLLEIC
tara:strand:+ start:35555 stop:36214 length:660 start_codon:yes stop_codon:yes gene_type:complete